MENELIEVEPQKYRLNVEYYGADFPVDVLVKRMQDGDFIIPGFQREYVWKELEASRFIESLLIGLPTAALFLAKDKFSNQYLVIDGQQRLKTLEYFYRGNFPDGKPFRLKGVTPPLSGMTYSDLSLSDRRALGNSVIHCIIISDNYDPAGMFHLFERLNTTGSPLTAQEIRNAIYHGAFSKLLQKLSQDETWRAVFGKPGIRAEEQELILRFFALHFDFENYRGNLVDFLNDFMLSNHRLDRISSNEMESVFYNTLNFLSDCVGPEVFIHNKQFSKVLFDSLMFFASRRAGDGLDCERFKRFYKLLISDAEFWSMSQRATTSRKSMEMRFEYVEKLYQTLNQ